MLYELKDINKKIKGENFNLFQQVHIICPSLFFISGWRKWKAARHCIKPDSTKNQYLPKKKTPELVSSNTVPERERSSNYAPVHAPCPRIHSQHQKPAISFSVTSISPLILSTQMCSQVYEISHQTHLKNQGSAQDHLNINNCNTNMN